MFRNTLHGLFLSCHFSKELLFTTRTCIYFFIFFLEQKSLFITVRRVEMWSPNLLLYKLGAKRVEASCWFGYLLQLSKCSHPLRLSLYSYFKKGCILNTAFQDRIALYSWHLFVFSPLGDFYDIISVQWIPFSGEFFY